MREGPVRIVAASVGVSSSLVAGVLAGGWWWVVAVVGAVAAAGSVADRHLGHAQVLSCLVVSVGLAAEGRAWFVPLLVAGVIGSIELAAAADRTTIIRRHVPGVRPAILAACGSALVAGAVLLVGHVPLAVVSGSVVVAAAAGVVATRVIAR
ncbi:hypothetical protein [Actinospongicola halichondriae]|uniref:hypothetical protein n=1 Tax=Actinospongicola halichondriae TaxID=3236844 RepID=UPI003D441CBE